MSVLNNGPCLNEQQKVELCGEVTDEEIHNAVFGIDMDKALGPDGFSSGFFRSSWNIVKEEISEAVRDFFSTGKLLKQVNTTIITLVLKVDCPNTVGDYRPISCCV